MTQKKKVNKLSRVRSADWKSSFNRENETGKNYKHNALAMGVSSCATRMKGLSNMLGLRVNYLPGEMTAHKNLLPYFLDMSEILVGLSTYFRTNVSPNEK